MVAVTLLFAAGLAAKHASAGELFGFYPVANNGQNANTATWAQFTMVVSDGGTVGGINYVDFHFANAGGSASSITDIYFQDGTLLGVQGVSSESVGVNFSSVSNPTHVVLPGDNTFSSHTTIADGGYFASADATAPVQPDGINPGEWLDVQFALVPGTNWQDTVNALRVTPWPGPGQGALRVGIHVQGFDNGGSESFITEVIPLPHSGALAACGLCVGLGTIRRRRRA
jgi:hypothetical protein